ILEIKQNFSATISLNNPVKKRLDKLVGELYHRFTGTFLFEPEGEYHNKLAQKRKKEQERLEKEIESLSHKMEEIRENRIYQESFEWRFEFPDALNDQGDFVGFDVVIANPPYIRQEALGDIKNYLSSTYKVYSPGGDIFSYF